MKKLIVSAFMLGAMATTSFAQDTKSPAQVPATSTKDDSKTKVDPTNLPQSVKTTLAGAEYKDWTTQEVWLVKATPEYYAVQLKKDQQSMTVNIDKDGKVRKS